MATRRRRGENSISFDHRGPCTGDLVEDFNFDQAPRPPVLLPTNPPTDSPSIPAYFKGKPACLGCTVPPPAGQRAPAPEGSVA